MTINKWEKLSSKTIIEDKWINLSEEEYKNNGVLISPYYLLHYPDWVLIVAISKENELVMVKQYRPGSDKIELELPAGIMEKTDLSPVDTAVRELSEETGYKGDRQEFVGTLSVASATHTNAGHVVLVTGATKVSPQRLDKTEWIEVCTLKINEIEEYIKNGSLSNAPHIGAFYLTKLKYPELFR